MSILTQEELKERLHYDPLTGIFTWLEDRSNVKAGSEAGCVDFRGYCQIGINGERYLAHRLAFLYVEGYFPEGLVDHKKSKSNKWSNLRHATPACNMQNREIQTNNTSGFNGVSWSKKRNKYQAKIQITKKHIYLGLHVDKISAALARVAWEDQCDKWTCDYQQVNRVKLREWGYQV